MKVLTSIQAGVYALLTEPKGMREEEFPLPGAEKYTMSPWLGHLIVPHCQGWR